MEHGFVNLTVENLEDQHLCCAISDKKHQKGVEIKKEWLKDRIAEGHTFRKGDVRGKVFIEYAPVETAWAPITGDGYLYVYCLWVSGGFKGQGWGGELLEYCLEDAKAQGKAGICTISTKKKKPFLSDKKFFQRYGFQTVDAIGGEYELLALGFDEEAAPPQFTPEAKLQRIDSPTLTIYHGKQCPCISNCLSEVRAYCDKEGVPLELVEVDTLEKAKAVPCVFNNWAVFLEGEFQTVHLLNEGYLKKLLKA